MVKLHIKKGDDSQFLYDTTVQAPMEDVLKDIVQVYNGRLKVQRICAGKHAHLRYKTINGKVWLCAKVHLNCHLLRYCDMVRISTVSI